MACFCLCPITGCLEKVLPNTLCSVLGLIWSLEVYIKDKYFVCGLTGEGIDIRGVRQGRDGSLEYYIKGQLMCTV